MNRLTIRNNALRLTIAKQGPAGVGTAGTSSYLYVAYAADDEGADFSLTPDLTRPYRAELVSATVIAEPTAEDFEGLWVRFIGDPGASGPNAVTGATTTNLTGLLKGNGATVSAATPGTDFATAAEGDLAAAAVQPGSSPSFGVVSTTSINSSGDVRSGGWRSQSYFTSLDWSAIGLYLQANGIVGFSSDNIGSAIAWAIQSGEINNGTAGQHRDLTLRVLIATGCVRFPSYTVAAANALVGMVAGDTINVTNEVGGATLATYNGGAWKRATDLAIISA